MSYNNQNDKKEQTVPAPQWLLKKARARLAYTKEELNQARARIPAEYHDFLLMLSQNERIADNSYKIDDRNGGDLGLYSYKNGTYLTIDKPYVTVDGRVQMLRDEHEAANKKFHIHSPIISHVNDIILMSVTVDSEIHGSATGMIEVGIGGKGVDVYNPIANAQTSAIGRALGFLGYGLVGTGVIESPEEVGNMLNQDDTPKHPQQEQKQKSSNAPINWRVQVIGDLQSNPDGSATCAAKMENQQVIQVVFKASQRDFSHQLVANHVINVTGWLNESKLRLVVADNSNSLIENVSA